jgi:tetratricopeptide (TPR) repeat protein
MLPAVILSLLLSWVQISSDTYVIKSSAGEEAAKRVLSQLEGFHQLVGSLVFRSTQLPELPIEVLLIGDEATLKELAPVYQGRKIDVAGYYQRGQDRDFIVLSGRERARNLTGIAYHELTHYFLSRALVNRPAWLSEGLAEYFSTADVRNDRIVLGALSPERLQLLRTERLLPVEELFAVTSSSPYYNESRKANVFYAESWAFIYYMMHGAYADAFKSFIEASTTSQANLLDYLRVKPNELDSQFMNYLRMIAQRSSNTTLKINSQNWSMKVESIPEAQAQISMAEIFLASGEVEQARRYFEVVNTIEEEFPRASYYRGVLARLASDPAARDFFIDALSDPHLGPRAAVQLVQLGELHIPTVRTLLEQAAAANTRMADVYLALADIYTEEIQRIQEAVRLRRQAGDLPAVPIRAAAAPVEAQVAWQSYASGVETNTAWELLASSAAGPRLESFIEPFYPPDLIAQKASGKVVMEVQVTERGEVAGVWLITADPEVFGTLATAVVREWRFEPFPSKIRVVLDFKP